MTCRKLELTLISATGLEEVRLIGYMSVHARVTFGNKAETEKRTPADTHGKTDPAWNFTMSYMVRDASLENHGTRIVIKLYCSRSLGDRYIGEVNVPVKELYEYGKPSGGSGVVTYPVQKGAINSTGMLKFSYSFGGSINFEDVPAECILV